MFKQVVINKLYSHKKVTITDNQLLIIKKLLMLEKKSVGIHVCPVTFTMSKIGGKWKPIILHLINVSTPDRVSNRFGVMQRGIEGISKQMLTKQLRELEADGILSRTIYAEIPPRVEYNLTDLGQSLLPIIKSMKQWGEHHM